MRRLGIVLVSSAAAAAAAALLGAVATRVLLYLA